MLDDLLVMNFPPKESLSDERKESLRAICCDGRTQFWRVAFPDDDGPMTFQRARGAAFTLAAGFSRQRSVARVRAQQAQRSQPRLIRAPAVDGVTIDGLSRL